MCLLLKKINVLLWAVSIFAMLTMLFVVHPNINGTPHSVTFNTLYQVTSRNIWALGTAYIIYACATSNGGIVNKFLSLKIFGPLSRLCYSAFLLHIMVQALFHITQYHLMHFQPAAFVIIIFLSSILFDSTFLPFIQLIYFYILNF